MLFGPRQSGKTTIVLQALDRIDSPSAYASVDDPLASNKRFRDFAGPAQSEISLPPRDLNADWLIWHWEHARRAARNLGNFILVIDEIQHIPDWSSTIKGLWDADRRNNTDLRVVILGSAPLAIQRGLNESLVGRFSVLPVRHWSYQEMSQAFGFTLDEYLYFGGFPGACKKSLPATGGDLFEEFWINYVLDAVLNPTVDRDVVAMTHIRKPALMRGLFELGAAYSGQILSFNKMVGQLNDAGNTTTLAGYLRTLESVGLLAGLQNFSGPLRRTRSSSPKLNVLNTAAMTANSGYSFAEAKADRTYWGRIVESAVGAHLFNTASRRTKVFYWRHRNQEVDFVLSRGPQLLALEVGVPGTRKSRSNLEAFAKRFRRARSLLVGAGGMPLEEFLSAPADSWFDRQ